jgi:hypothetical protein
MRNMGKEKRKVQKVLEEKIDWMETSVIVACIVLFTVLMFSLILIL